MQWVYILDAKNCHKSVNIYYIKELKDIALHIEGKFKKSRKKGQKKSLHM
jgi:hypothetical protein